MEQRVRTSVRVGIGIGIALVALAAPVPAGATGFAPAVNRLASVPANGQLAAVACPTPSRCVAVGSDLLPYNEQFGDQQPFVLSGNPARWTIAQARPVLLGPAFGDGGTLAAVACPSSTECVAVGGDENGQPLEIVGNPSSWGASQATELTLGGTFGDGGSLDAVSCTAPGSCVAVGSDANGNPLVLDGDPTTWSGSVASELSVPSSAGNVLDAIACTSADSCTAVGSADGGRQPLLVSGNPTAWGSAVSVLSLGASFGGGGQLDAIACTSDTACVAAGSDGPDPQGGPKREPLMLVGDPSTWGVPQARQVALPKLLGTDGSSLAAIQCQARTSCVAVGDAGTGEPLVIRGDPASWGASQAVTLKLGAALGSSGAFQALACRGSASCTAVGVDGSDEPLDVTGSPASWIPTTAEAVQLSGVPFGVESQAAALDCASQHACVEVDNVAWDDGDDTATIEAAPNHWPAAESRWLVYGKTENDDGTLASLACTAPTACIAVGSDGLNEPLMLRGNPRNWSAGNAQELLLGSQLNGGELNGVSCASPTSCVAVGMDGNLRILILRGNPATWRGTQAVEIPLGSRFGGGGSLNSVVCVSKAMCVAVGVDAHGEPLVIRGNPSQWNAGRATPIDLGAAFGSLGSLQSVACITATSCVAVGSDANAAPIVLTGNPAHWSAAKAVALSIAPASADDVVGYGSGDATTGSLVDVRCTGAHNCVAVGADGTGAPIYEVGDPATWGATPAQRPLATPAVPGTFDGFTAVSCSGGTCEVTGDAMTGTFLSSI